MSEFSKCIAVVAVLTTLAACSPADETDAPDPSNDALTNSAIGSADMIDPAGADLGTVELRDAADGIELALSLSGLEPGEKAFHLHSVGDCSAADFTSAGGHLNPEDKTHGALSDGGQHLGDLPNVLIDETGSIDTEVLLESPLQDLSSFIFDDDGTAIMFHAGPDDYLTDPAGAAGPRVACGVVQPAGG